MCCVSVVAHCINSSISEQIYITNIVLLWNIRGATNLVWSRGVFMITFMDQTIRLNTQSIHRPLFLLRRHSLYVDKKYKAWRVVGRGWNVKRKRSLGLLPSLIFHIVSPSYGQFQSHTCILNAADVHREWLIFILKPDKHFSLQPVKHCRRDVEKNKSSWNLSKF